VNWSRELIGRAGYYIRLAVSPANEDEILISNSSFFQSTDGGQTFRSVNWGGDNHDIWWDPKDADRFVITHDAGLTITAQHARSTQRVVKRSRVPDYLLDRFSITATTQGIVRVVIKGDVEHRAKIEVETKNSQQTPGDVAVPADKIDIVLVAQLLGVGRLVTDET